MPKKLLFITFAILILTNQAAGSSFNVTAEVVSPLGYYTAALDLTANKTATIIAPQINTTIMLTTSRNSSGNITMYLTSTPVDVPPLGVPSLNRYLKIEADSRISNNLSYALIKFYYTDEDIIRSGIEEGSLGFFWWNGTSSSWEKLSPAPGWVYGAGVDTFENYVWVNVTHFSDYSPGGKQTAPSLKIMRDMPATVFTRQKFNATLTLINLADFKIHDIYLKEKMPAGYVIEEKGISPKPVLIKREGNYIAIYWKFKELAVQKNLTMKYSATAPASSGYYAFKADAFGFDAYSNKYAAYNIAKQKVKKTLFESLLELLGI